MKEDIVRNWQMSFPSQDGVDPEMVDLVNREAEQQSGMVHRGISVTPEVAAGFEPGKTVSMPISSWTTHEDVANGFATTEQAEGNAAVVLHASPGSMGLTCNKYAADDEFETLHEVVSGGAYTVSRVEHGSTEVMGWDGEMRSYTITHVYVSQVR